MINPIFALPKRKGAVAQLVEQRTENPCVGGSIPSITTKKNASLSRGIFYFPNLTTYFQETFPVGSIIPTALLFLSVTHTLSLIVTEAGVAGFEGTIA